MTHSISLSGFDYMLFAAYFAILSLIGWRAGRNQSSTSAGYFLAGRSLPWYVVGSSFIAANISSEHFIGMVGAAVIYGVCVATPEWSSIIAFTFLIWIFIPFLLSAKVFTAPEFLERRFSSTMRFFFALVTVLVNVFGFLAPVLYGGGLALDSVVDFRGIWMEWTAGSGLGSNPDIGLYLAIVFIGIAAGGWAIWGGLKSVAWMDVITIVVMFTGGLLVTWYGLKVLGGGTGSIVHGFAVMVERNQAHSGVWKEAVENVRQHIVPGADHYDRLSVIQPVTHETTPWTHWVLSFFYIGLWYTVINQFMIQRVLAARSLYDARAGIVLAGFMKLLLPFIVVVPGLIFFALHPEVLMAHRFEDIRPAADRTYLILIRDLVPVGLKGLLLAALFGAIQSTVSAVLTSTSTIATLDLYKRFFNPTLDEQRGVRIGRWVTAVSLVIAILIGIYISSMKASMFVYIQELFTFFAPPFSAVFLLGTLWRRINGPGGTITVFVGFIFGLGVKIWVNTGGAPLWLAPYANQGVLNWAICMVLCIGISLLTAPPRPEQITDDLTFNWRRFSLSEGVGDRWYKNLTFWWALSFAGMLGLIIIFGAIL